MAAPMRRVVLSVQKVFQQKFILGRNVYLSCNRCETFARPCLSSFGDVGTRFNFRTLTVSSASHVKENKKTGSAPPVHDKQEFVLVFSSTDMLVGRMSISNAEDLAKKENLKLVDIGINQDKIQCYKLVTGREFAKESKKVRELKKKEKHEEMKEYAISPKITDHDLQIKMDKITGSLRKGNQVRISISNMKRMDTPEQEKENSKRQSRIFSRITQNFQELATIKTAEKTSSKIYFTLIPKVKDEKV